MRSQESVDFSRSIGIPIVCAGAEMRKVLETVSKIGREEVPVLLTGETGVGKDVVAQAIHRLSRRTDKDFAVLNCSSLSREMLESQLFGHRKGSFTGAINDYAGIIRSASGGTLFLDEIGDLDLAAQPKLLRFLQYGEVLPIGEPRPFKVDVRLVAATNKDLHDAVDKGSFRSDLLYRINTIRIHIPPLRQRRDEIPHLVDYYLKYYRERSNKMGIVMAGETVSVLTSYHWPGNIRQLNSELQRIVAFADDDDVITPEHLSPEIIFSQGGVYVGRGGFTNQIDVLLQEKRLTLSDALDVFEKALISRALELHSGLISPTARDLGITRRGFKMKLRRFDIKVARREKTAREHYGPDEDEPEEDGSDEQTQNVSSILVS
jgi:transcriptional regulator with GAF, ATPase, and Fis domain